MEQKKKKKKKLPPTERTLFGPGATNNMPHSRTPTCACRTLPTDLWNVKYVYWCIAQLELVGFNAQILVSYVL
jgi:hypothetical protein